MIFWSVLIYAFDGCEAASCLGDEIKNSRRAIPRALFIAGITVAFCYIIGTIAILVALPSTEVGNLQGLMQAISATAHKREPASRAPTTSWSRWE
jgi:amino acid transporter